MATLTPGVLLKLLQSMNSDTKPFGEHRSPVLQVAGIVPAPSDDLWPSHGFYLQLSDSLHSTYVSLSHQDSDLVVSNRPQLGQLVHLDRLLFDLPVPRALNLRPIPSPRYPPFVTSPEPLIVLSTPSHAPGFVIQPASPSSAAKTIKLRAAVSAQKENFIPSATRPKRRFSSPASRNASPFSGSRAASPVPSKCEVPSLVAAREEKRGVVREAAIVVPSRYRQGSPVGRKAAGVSPMGRKGAVSSPGGRRLSGGIKWQASPAASEAGAKRKAGLGVGGIARMSDGRLGRKSWDENSSGSEKSFGESKVKEQVSRKGEVA